MKSKKEALSELELLLSETEQQIENLFEIRRTLVFELTRWKLFPEEELSPALSFIETNPGCTKQDLRDHLGVSEKELNTIIRKASRNWGVIVNRGTRRNPKWHLSNRRVNQRGN